MEPCRQRGAAYMQKCVSVRRVADCPQHDGAVGTTFSSVRYMNCHDNDVAGRCTVPAAWTTATSGRSSDCPSSGVPMAPPPSSTCTRLGSPCNRVHFMTIKAGNVVDKARRRLRNACASSSAAMFHPVSITYRHISLISSAKIK